MPMLLLNYISAFYDKIKWKMLNITVRLEATDVRLWTVVKMFFG